jgi:hypothetical protein
MFEMKSVLGVLTSLKGITLEKKDDG